MINTYYILNWYCSYWWYFNIISPGWQFEYIINNCCHTLNDATEVADNIRDKFNKEGLEKYINIISEECAKSALEICNVLSSNVQNLNDYIQGELG